MSRPDCLRRAVLAALIEMSRAKRSSAVERATAASGSVTGGGSDTEATDQPCATEIPLVRRESRP